MGKIILTSLKAIIMFTVIFGFLYTVLITLIAQIIFPVKANGSMIIKDNLVIGSELISQKFESNKYFWSRPSAIDYNPMPSGASNFGPTSKILKEQSEEREMEFLKNNLLKDSSPIPSEMKYASASGIDPHISPEAAILQIERISEARKFTVLQKKKLLNLVTSKMENPFLGFVGEYRINVLLLNLELDNIK